MSIVSSLTSPCRLAVLLVSAMIVSCSTQEPLSNQYQSDAEVTQQQNRPAAELQQQALSEIDAGRYQQAADYLQRAIRIQPRNAWSWHYLATVYWYQGRLDRCLAMIDRSSSYAGLDDAVGDVNDRLRMKCR